MNKKAIMLLSGGLDSLLAARIMMEQGVELFVYHGISVFCNCTSKGCCIGAGKLAREFSLPLRVENLTNEKIEIVQAPKHGYGKNMNPCIDCRILLFRRAKVYMAAAGASFVVTGEVLGERPMSQRLNAMNIIERESGLKGLVLRPLSARLLKRTLPEAAGVVDRSRLLSVQGRSRKPQIALAKDYGLKDYPCPAGGCLLTDKNFAQRLRDLMKYEGFDLNSIHLLKLGRHFRLADRLRVIIGRDEKENHKLLTLAKEDDFILRTPDCPGPVSLVRGEVNNGLLEKAAAIAVSYSDAAVGKRVKFLCCKGGESRGFELENKGR